ncbi:hypothetical protein KY285_007898 [Solanum tuberosum]|nr:hypothetical protein KY285_007898 [Solanum tuberosum]
MAVTDREELGEKSITVMFQPLEEENLDGGTKEAIPLGIQFPEEDMSTSDWIQQNITKLSSEFGVNFKGCEEKAKELLMKIDNNKQGNRGEQSKQTTGKRKGLLELKRLQLDSKFYSNALEVKGGGGVWPLWINEFKHCVMECEGAELWEEKEYYQEHDKNLETRCGMFSRDKNRGGDS